MQYKNFSAPQFPSISRSITTELSFFRSASVTSMICPRPLSFIVLTFTQGDQLTLPSTATVEDSNPAPLTLVKGESNDQSRSA